MTRRSYSREFKVQAVKMITEQEKPALRNMEGDPEGTMRKNHGTPSIGRELMG